MGFSIAWIAVRTEDHTALFDLAEVSSTDEPDEYYETPISGAALENGWFLLVGRRCDNRLVDSEFLQILSNRWDCIATTIEEHVMHVTSSYWSSGSELWSIVHDAQNGINHLESRGSLPSDYDAIRADKIQQQEAEGGESADVDVIFDVPLEIAKRFFGFRHDEDCDVLAQECIVSFTDLARHPSGRKPPWWKLW